MHAEWLQFQHKQSHQKAGTVEMSPTPAITVMACTRDSVPCALLFPSDGHKGFLPSAQPILNESSNKEVE